MALKGFRYQQQKDPSAQRMAVAIKDFTQQLERNPLLDGLLVENVTIATTDTNVVHGLGRDFRGWIIVRRDAAADVYEGTQINEAQYLTLIASSSVTVSLYVF